MTVIVALKPAVFVVLAFLFWLDDQYFVYIQVVVSNNFYIHPYLGKWSNLTNIVQMGWNHQPVCVFVFYLVITKLYSNHWCFKAMGGVEEHQGAGFGRL